MGLFPADLGEPLTPFPDMKLYAAYITLDNDGASLDEEHFSEFSRMVEFSDAIEPDGKTDFNELFALLGDRTEQYLVLKVEGEIRDYIQYMLTRNTGMKQLSHLELFLSDRFNAQIFVRERTGDAGESRLSMWEALVDEL